MACLGKGGQVLCLCGLEPCPHEVVSGKSCWHREASQVQPFRRAQREKGARRMIHPALPGKQDQSPLCEDRGKFGFDFGSHKKIRQHLVCGFVKAACLSVASLLIPQLTGSACVLMEDFPASHTKLEYSKTLDCFHPLAS